MPFNLMVLWCVKTLWDTFGFPALARCFRQELDGTEESIWFSLLPFDKSES